MDSRPRDKHLELVREEISLTLREAEENDARAILGLMRHVGRNTNYLSVGPSGLDLSVSEEEAFIRRYARSERSLLLLAEVDDQLIGIANLSALSGVKQNHVAEVGLAIVKEYWGYGIGKLLVEEMIEFAKKVNIRVLTLEVVTENQRAIKLYQHFGFEQKGQLSQRLRHGIIYYDVYVMEKVLG